MMAVTTPDSVLVLIAVLPAAVASAATLGAVWIQNRGKNRAWLREQRLNALQQYFVAITEFQSALGDYIGEQQEALVIDRGDSMNKKAHRLDAAAVMIWLVSTTEVSLAVETVQEGVYHAMREAANEPRDRFSQLTRAPEYPPYSELMDLVQDFQGVARKWAEEAGRG
jgi:hypothetical protein